MAGELTKNRPTSTANPSAHQQRSLIKPYLHNLSGSGSQIEGVIIERNVDQCDTDFDSRAITTEKHLVVLHARNPATLEFRVNGSVKEFLFSEGDAIINPVGTFINPHWDAPEVEILLLAIEPTFVSRIAAKMDRSDRVELTPHFHFRDALLEPLVRTLSTAFEQDLPPNRIYVESLTHTLIVHLLSRYSVLGLKQSSISHGLSSKKLALVKDYISSHIDESLSLEALANLVELSPSHFLRLFKRATGSSPHQYVIAQRLEKAKALLSQTKLSIPDIACQTGFADQSHLTRLMRRHTGLSPKIIRDK
ncbi:MAG: helix-turn-helix domain-containing protein [Cyanophyceae cyanobacterium]